MDLTPPNSKVIVELQKIEETVTDSGIILGADSPKEQEHPHDVLKGKVVAVGVECRYVELGMDILFEQRFSAPFNLTSHESELKILHEKDIAGIENYDVWCQNRKALGSKPVAKELGAMEVKDESEKTRS
jgi:co-chaperonin GroES (HSP10)